MLKIFNSRKVALILFVYLLFVLGIFIGHKRYLHFDYQKIISSNEVPQESILNKLDSKGLINRIRIHDQNDIQNFRKKLIKIVWDKEGFPYQKLPDTVIKNVRAQQYPGLQNVKQINKIIDTLEYGFVSNIYHFIPENGDNNKVMIYHHGHGGIVPEGLHTFDSLLLSGYHVIGVNMPLLGENNQPEVDLPTTGKIKITNHDIMVFLERPYPVFFEPIRTAINYLNTTIQPQVIHMMGLSGGGWTTQLYAAIDTSIQRSYPVAGSIPMDIRFYSFRDLGDMEQHDPRIYSKVSYPEIYVLGAYGKNRGQLQVLNSTDPCCFSAELGQYFESSIVSKVNTLGHGQFNLFIDTTHDEHRVSPAAVHQIMSDLNSFNP